MKNILILLGILIFAGCQNPTAPAPPEQMAPQIKTAKIGVHSEIDTARMLDELFRTDSSFLEYFKDENGNPPSFAEHSDESIFAIKDDRVRLLTAWNEWDRLMSDWVYRKGNRLPTCAPGMRGESLGGISGAILDRYNINLDDDDDVGNAKIIRAFLANPVRLPDTPDDN